MTEKELKIILEKHGKWLDNDPTGERASLQGANLHRANLHRASLQGANLHRANLQETNLQEANLHRANLHRASLQGANLHRANLQWANLRRASLRRASLQGANLQEADLQWANLHRANLQETNLQEASLQEANLYRANLREVKGLYRLPFQFQVCPRSGPFEAWKKGTNNCIIKLKIPWFARRTSNIKNRKSRSELAIVKAVYNSKGNPIKVCKNKTFKGRKIEYRVGCFVHSRNYDASWIKDCSNGIHFFMTKEEAENW